MNEQELLEKTDKYLRGELPEEDHYEFQEMIRKDPVLSAKVREQLVLLEKLRFYGERKKLKEQLDKFHREVTSSEMEKSKPGFLAFNFSNPSLAIAASVTGMLLVSISFYLGLMYSSNKKESTKYQLLSHEVKKIEATQNEMIKDLKESKSAPVLSQAHFSGTGFLISSKGYILTSNHLIQDAESIFVENEEIGSIKVQQVYKDDRYDIALLKIEEESCKSIGKAPFLLKKKDAELGEKVFTLGFPREDIVYGEGSISSASGYEGDTLSYQISIPLNPGNSGGPLLDEQGNLIGIISGKNAGAEASSFAIKAEYVLEFLTNDKENEVLMPQKNSISYLKRNEQIKKLKPFIFNIRVY